MQGADLDYQEHDKGDPNNILARLTAEERKKMLSRTLVIILSFCGIMLLTPMSAAESLKDYLKVISTTRIEILNMSTRLDGQDLDLAQGAREILAARESETTHVVDLEEIDVEVSEPLPKATITSLSLDAPCLRAAAKLISTTFTSIAYAQRVRNSYRV